MKSIVFNQNEVKATLDERKTQIRRVIKNYNKTPLDCGRDKFYKTVDKLNNKIGLFAGFYKDSDIFIHEGKEKIDAIYFKCPYQIGDVLWVKETFKLNYFSDGRTTYRADWNDKIINGDIKPPKWCPSVHMPREAARLFLTVENRWVERLQDIKDIDIKAEGIVLTKEDAEFDNEFSDEAMRSMQFQVLWDSTIKKQDLDRYGYNANPWVINYEFKQTDCI